MLLVVSIFNSIRTFRLLFRQAAPCHVFFFCVQSFCHVFIELNHNGFLSVSKRFHFSSSAFFSKNSPAGSSLKLLQTFVLESDTRSPKSHLTCGTSEERRNGPERREQQCKRFIKIQINEVTLFPFFSPLKKGQILRNVHDVCQETRSVANHLFLPLRNLLRIYKSNKCLWINKGKFIVSRILYLFKKKCAEDVLHKIKALKSKYGRLCRV